MIITLDDLYPYYYYAHDRDKYGGLINWIKHYNGIVYTTELGADKDYAKFTEEDLLFIKLMSRK